MNTPPPKMRYAGQQSAESKAKFAAYKESSSAAKRRRAMEKALVESSTEPVVEPVVEISIEEQLAHNAEERQTRNALTKQFEPEIDSWSKVEAEKLRNLIDATARGMILFDSWAELRREIYDARREASARAEADYQASRAKRMRIWAPVFMDGF